MASIKRLVRIVDMEEGEKANYGHAGRPGKRGGSAKRTGAARAVKPLLGKRVGKAVTGAIKYAGKHGPAEALVDASAAITKSRSGGVGGAVKKIGSDIKKGSQAGHGVFKKIVKTYAGNVKKGAKLPMAAHGAFKKVVKTYAGNAKKGAQFVGKHKKTIAKAALVGAMGVAGAVAGARVGKKIGANISKPPKTYATTPPLSVRKAKLKKKLGKKEIQGLVANVVAGNYTEMGIGAKEATRIVEAIGGMYA